MRLIDADAFKENIKCVCDAGGWLEPVTTAIKEYICKQVDYQTTVDAVEVVRCENCDYWHRSNECFSYGMCKKVWMNRDATFYCKSGERKTDG